MPNYDPTLGHEEELALINRVKANADNQALTTLIQQHTGIYFSIVHRYATTYPDAIKLADMTDDKMFNIYEFVMAYNPHRDTKLGTYIGNRTDWLCKSMLKTEKRDPLSTAMAHSWSDEDSGMEIMTIPDSGVESMVVEKVNTGIAIEDIVEEAAKVSTDPQFIKILGYRNRSMSWRNIGHQLGISHEWARKIYNQHIVLLQTHLNPV